MTSQSSPPATTWYSRPCWVSALHIAAQSLGTVCSCRVSVVPACCIGGIQPPEEQAANSKQQAASSRQLNALPSVSCRCTPALPAACLVPDPTRPTPPPPTRPCSALQPPPVWAQLSPAQSPCLLWTSSPRCSSRRTIVSTGCAAASSVAAFQRVLAGCWMVGW